MSKKILLTMDIDWVSEAVIKSALDFVKLLNISCILFQTHYSEVIHKEQSSLFIKELHPNFCENSDHGSNFEAIINHINQLEHKGIAIRAHKYYMPEEAVRVYGKFGFRFSMNNYTDMKYIKPYKIYGDINEINTFFEDGFYLKQQLPFKTNYVLEKMISDGIYVFNIHPIHLAFNAKEYSLTRNFKDGMTKNHYRSIDDDFIKKYSCYGYGIRSFLTDLFIQMKKNDFQFISVSEVSL